MPNYRQKNRCKKNKNRQKPNNNNNNNNNNNDQNKNQTPTPQSNQPQHKQQQQQQKQKQEEPQQQQKPQKSTQHLVATPSPTVNANSQCSNNTLAADHLPAAVGNNPNESAIAQRPRVHTAPAAYEINSNADGTAFVVTPLRGDSGTADGVVVATEAEVSSSEPVQCNSTIGGASHAPLALSSSDNDTVYRRASSSSQAERAYNATTVEQPPNETVLEMGAQNAKMAPATASSPTGSPQVSRKLELQETPAKQSPQGKVIVHRVVPALPTADNSTSTDSPQEVTQPASDSTQAKSPLKQSKESEESEKSEEQRQAKVIIHRILLADAGKQQATITTEPQLMKATIEEVTLEERATEVDSNNSVAQPTAIEQTVSSPPFAELQIQEVSDGGSLSDCNDNPPLVSEAESESSESFDTHSPNWLQEHGHIVSIQTLPLQGAADSDSDSEQLKCLSPTNNSSTTEEQKQRQRQTRAALEAHFRPQYLSPRYLDSISEENSDVSDCAAEQMLAANAAAASQHEQYEQHDHSDDGKAKRANAIFPKSQLDFTKKHKHGALPKAPLLSAAAICEEPTVATIVIETKFIERLSTNQLHTEPETVAAVTSVASLLTPASEAAEVVYINSASSSASDLHDLNDDENDTQVLLCVEQPQFIDLDTDAQQLIAAKPTLPSDDGEDEAENELHDSSHESSRERTPVNHTSATTSESESPTPTSSLTAQEPAAEVSELNLANTRLDNNANAIKTKTTTITTIVANSSMNSMNSMIASNDKTIMLNLSERSPQNAQLSNAKTTNTNTNTTNTTTTITDDYYLPYTRNTSQSLSSGFAVPQEDQTDHIVTESIERLYAGCGRTTLPTAENANPTTSSNLRAKHFVHTPVDVVCAAGTNSENFENMNTTLANVREIGNANLDSVELAYGNNNNNNKNNNNNYYYNNNNNNTSTYPHTTKNNLYVPYGEQVATETHTTTTPSSLSSNMQPAATRNSPPPLPPTPTSASPTPPTSASPTPPPIPPPSQEHYYPATQTQASSYQAVAPAAAVAAAAALPTPTPTATLPAAAAYTAHNPSTLEDSTSSAFRRQESAESHCSDSTTHSQCTAIRAGAASPHSDLDAMASPISERPISWPSTAAADSNSGSNETAAIKKLRLLCAETLASLPYGEQVLEELATVAQNIGEVRANQSVYQQQQQQSHNMPYPLPQLPHIDALQLTLAHQQPPDKSKMPLASTQPIAAPPNLEQAPWLALPTDADPQLLVCLSPAQRNHYMSSGGVQQMTADKRPDQLLDAHRKFVERRGYHEYSDEQVKAMEAAYNEEQRILETTARMRKLRKSLTPTPPPPPIPPPPVPTKSCETAAKAQIQAKAAAAATTTTATTTNTNDYGINLKNANEPATVTCNTSANSGNSNNAAASEENKHRLLAIIQDSTTAAGTQQQTAPQTSSLENSSRQSAAAAASLNNYTHSCPFECTVPLVASAKTANTTHSTDTTDNIPKMAAIFTADTASRHYTAATSNNGMADKSAAAADTTTTTTDFKRDLKRMFPLTGGSNIFDGTQRRYSNIESSSGAPYCEQLPKTQPKRYSSIETSSYESKKRTENGQLVFDYTNENRERRHEGNADGSAPLQCFTGPSSGAAATAKAACMLSESRQTAPTNAEKIMSAFKLKTDECPHDGGTTADAATKLTNTQATTAATAQRALRGEFIKNRQMSEQFTLNKDISGTYEEFRQRAKAAGEPLKSAAAAPAPSAAPFTNHNGANETTKSTHFDHEKLFKEFDELSQQLHMELESGKETKKRMQQYERATSLYDLSCMPTEFKHEFEDLKKRRHEHMQELEREIERSMRSRQLRQTAQPQATPRSYKIPIQLEGAAHAAKTYDIPIQLEPSYQVTQPLTPQHLNYADSDERYRRAESMFNLSEQHLAAQPLRQRSVSINDAEQQRQQRDVEDDWYRYANDLGSSQNIAKPLAREVEICYQRLRPNAIRAPRLTVSTNDLCAPAQYFDAHNAYGARHNRQAPMLNSQATQQQRKPAQHLSCYSMLERDPNPTYITTTSRRGVSPAPPQLQQQQQQQQQQQPPPPSPQVSKTLERQRRASLPREIQEQQLKYIFSKEEELRTEVERLQHERQRLLHEMNAPPPQVQQMPQAPQRHMRPAPPPRLPTLSEDEVFRQQMAEEWLNKVAEREERRLQKIVKISKVQQEQAHKQLGLPTATLKTNISDEFLNRVKERRSKLAMPSDSDWESGAESQPTALAGQSSETEEPPPVRVYEGAAETDYRHLPKHLREFARFANRQSEQLPDGGQREVHEEEERREEASGNTVSSAVKKSSMVKTVTISGSIPERVIANGNATTATDYSPAELAAGQGPYQNFTPQSPTYRKLPAQLGEMFATSPFKGKIYEEFDNFWRNFDNKS